MAETDQKGWKLDPSLSIAPQIYRILRERIIRNDLTPGNRISETEIARVYDISRQPVREAFIKLAEQGLLEIRPQRGTTVRKIAYSAVLDARFLREAIEADIVKLVAETGDPDVTTELRKQVARQRDIAQEAPLAFIQEDEKFHRTLAEAAGKGDAWKLVEGLKSQMDRVRYLSLGQFPIEKLVQQHDDIVERIAAHDVAGAEAAVRLHLREVLRDLPEILHDKPDFFEAPEGATPDGQNRAIQGGENP